MNELYDILGVSPDADVKAIKSAFRKMARVHHPDLNPDDPTASERFIEIAAAFEILSDPDRRALYDEFGLESLSEDFDPIRARWDKRTRESPREPEEPWSARFKREFDANNSSFRSTFESVLKDFNPFKNSNVDHFYEDVFVEPGEDRRSDIEIDFLTSVRGGAVSFETSRHGSLTVRIPPGVAPDEVLLVAGEGEPSAHPSGAPGDLLLTVKIRDDKRWSRDGLNLEFELPVTIPEAILGARVTIPTPHGDCVMTLPEGIHSGAKLRLRQMGVHREEEKGDLHVIVKVCSPDLIDDRVRELARELERAYQKDVRGGLGE